ncbi:MAG TPA: peptide ABC transporter substrate-binding protein, partial [Ktedonobacteraceae bacterium]|nr:peptide ABC transporter substrate-binding protein [Ktedonobacteraceae bacterium]
VTPQMATYSISPDNLTYTFHLKPNLKFSDGTPLTANDAAYSIDRALSKPINDQTGVSGTYLGLIKDSAARLAGTKTTLIGDSINVVNPTTLTITVDHATGYFLQALTYPTAYVVEQSVITKWGAKWGDHLSDNGGQGGDGPFMVQSYDHSTGITLVPNPSYYGKAQTLKKVQLVFYKDTETAYKAFQAGQVDQTPVTPADNAAAQADTAEYHLVPQLWINYLTMNYLYKPFDNIDIRQAFELAINKDQIAQSIEKGQVTPTCHIVPKGMPGYNPNLQCPGGAPTKGDTAKAKQLFATGMAQEGLTLATFPTITLTLQSGTPDISDQATTMAQEWQSVLGVSVKTHEEDFNALLTDASNSTCQTPDDPRACLNKGLQMWFLAWIADYPDPQDWTTLQFDKGASNNNWNWGQNFSADAAAQVQVQKNLEAADINTNSTARIAAYNKAEQQLVNDVAWAPIDQQDNALLIRKDIQGAIVNSQDLTPPDDWANIYVSVH